MRSLIPQVIPLVLLLTACQSGGTQLPNAPSPEGAGSSRIPAAAKAELYIATVTTSRQLAIERHRLRDGIPQTHSDRVYTGSSGLIAVSADGTLYATIGLSPIVIDVYGSQSHTRLREIHVRPACHFSSSGFNVVNAVATDTNGYLFVLLYSYSGEPVLDAPRGTPCNGIAVFAPNAKGAARPVQTIQLSNTAGLDALAVDANDNLYVGGNSVVSEYANAVANPTLTRTFSGKYLGTVRALATDSAGDVFIANAQQSYTSAWIARYSPNTSGTGTPASIVYLEGTGPHWLWSLTERGRDLYVNDSGTSVDVYRAFENGQQNPIDSLDESKKVDTIAASS